MKNFIILLILPFTIYCQTKKLDTINIDLVTAKGLTIDVDLASRNLNEKYYNPIGLHMNIVHLGEQEIKGEDYMLVNSFRPNTTLNENIVVFVLPETHMFRMRNKFTMGGMTKVAMRIRGYAHPSQDYVVISEAHLYSSVLAHELGHVFSLYHIGEDNSAVMGANSYSGSNGEVLEFLRSEVKLIRENIMLRNCFKDTREYMKTVFGKEYKLKIIKL